MNEKPVRVNILIINYVQFSFIFKLERVSSFSYANIPG